VKGLVYYLRDGHEVQGFEQKMLRKICEAKKAEVSEECRTQFT
jgi:hypothetical protein